MRSLVKMEVLRAITHLALLASLWPEGGGEMVAKCPPEYVRRGGTTDCYLFHSGSKRTWSDASTYCQRETGNLVRIGTADMTGWLSLQIVESGLAGDSSEFWIDAVYNTNASAWYWASSGDLVDLTFIPVDKDPGDGGYGVLTTDSTLRGHNESSQYHFICHRSINEPMLCDYEEGWHMSDDRCYAVSDYRDSWLNAALTCQLMNGDLVTVSSDQEQFYVFDEAIRKHDNVWIGMTEIGHQDHFYWVGDNSSTFTYWNGSMPVSMNGEGSAVVDAEDNTGHWMVESAVNQHTFLCERPTGACVMGWEEFGDSCYYFNRQEVDIVTWNTAYDLCYDIGTNLLVINSQEEDDFVHGKLNAQKMWIGLYFNATGRQFEWVDGQAYNDSVTHMSGQDEDAVIDEGTVKCVTAQIETTEGGDVEVWTPMTCEETNAFVCEVPSGTPVYIHTPPLDQYCPDGWQLDQDFCYYVSEYEDSWPAGEDYCSAQGGHLASVNSWIEQDLIHTQLQGDSWIGLNDRREDFHFEWSDGNTVVIFNWETGEPTGNEENCVEMKVEGGYWNDLGCSDLRNFVCKRDYSTTPFGPAASTTSGPDFGNCGDGWWEDTDSGICYMFVDELLAFADARLHCQQMHVSEGQSAADIVSLQTMDEQLFVQGLVARAQVQDAGVYIGLKNDYYSQQLYWTSGEPVGLLYYADGMPASYYSYFCTQMLNDGGYKWADCLCTDRLPFLCEKKGLSYTAPTQPPSITECPADWIYFNGYCYYHGFDYVTFEAARDSCASMYGSTLSSILNKEENGFLYDLMFDQYSDFWLGMRGGSGGSFNTWLDGNPVGYENWYPGEPNNQTGTEECVDMLMYYPGGYAMWNDMPCDSFLPYVCKTRLKTCPGGWTQWEGKCYFVGSDTRTWNGALDACREVDGEASLLSWHSQEEVQYVEDLVDDTFGLTWLGLYREEGGAWKWSDGTADDFVNWRIGQPDHNDTEFCGLAITDPQNSELGFLENYPCDDSYHYACDFFPAHVIGCDEDWHYYNGYCYYRSGLTGESAAFDDARASCLNMDADLASVWSAEENDFLNSLMQGDGGDYHLGLRFSEADDSLVWTDGSPMLFTALNYITSSFNSGYFFYMAQYSTTWYHYIDRSIMYFCKKLPTITSLLPGTAGCLKDSDLYHGTSCYAKMTKATDYSSAARQCAEAYEGGHLVTIQNQMEEAFLSSQLSGAWPSMWIGLQETVSSDGTVGFKWDDGSDFTYDSWGEYEPKTDVGECARMSCTAPSLGLWYISDCAGSYPFVCEYERVGYTTAAPPKTTAGPAMCTEGWTRYATTQSCYKVMISMKSQALAEQSCVQFGGHLVSIHSELEETFLKKLPDLQSLGSSSFWTGMAVAGEAEDYQWLDGSVTDYLHWGNDQPNTHELHDTCVSARLDTFQWYDVYCDGYLPYICKTPQGIIIQSTAQPITSSPDVPCEDFPDDPRWLKEGDYCYRIYSQTEMSTQSWRGARRVCEDSGANLVSILSQAENSFLLSKVYIYSDDSLWTGGYAYYEGGFKWSDGQPFDYEHWDDGEPNSQLDQESCIALYPQKFGYWNDDNCGTTKGFICKKPLGGTAPPFTTAPPAAGHCPTGWIHAAGRCVRLAEEKVAFDEAQQRCRNSGINGNLLSIHGPAMQADVTVIMNLEAEPSWIGLRVTGGSFKWVDQTDFTYDNWGAGQPNNVQEEAPCVQVLPLSGYWEDLECLQNRTYICAQNPQTEVTTDSPPPMCQSPLDQYLNYSGSCYRAVAEARPWQEAEDLCKEEGTHLASVETIAENALVYAIALDAGMQEVWLGLNSKKDPAQYKWSDTFPVLYTHWGPEQPNVSDTDSRCVKLSTSQEGLWYNDRCEEQKPYFCKYTTEPIPTADPPVDGNCPNVHWQDLGGGYCYLFITDQIRTWNDANLICIQEKSQLASIHSQSELNLIQKATAHYILNLWIGFFQGTEGEFKWTDNTAVDFLHWADGEPNDYAERCVEMYGTNDRVWNDINCEVERAFVCKAKKSGGTAAVTSTESPLPTTAPDGTSPDGLSGGAIAGIVIGVLLVVAAVGFVGFHYRSKISDTVTSFRQNSSGSEFVSPKVTLREEEEKDEGGQSVA